MSRKAIFDAVRAAARPGLFNDPGNVHALDNLLDAFGVPVDGAPEAGGRRRIGPKGLAIIKQFEGLELKAYRCPAGVLTIGYGHTGPDVKPGMVITEAQADALLARDCERFERAVERLAPVVSQEQFDALVSFAFNLGEQSLANSTLLKKHNAGDHAGAAAEFGKWINAGGKQLAGLVKRRAAEAQLYRSGS